MTTPFQRKSGFTIVELLIVVVVIAILAAITVVAYNGVQQRAKAAVREGEFSSAVKNIIVRKQVTGDDLAPVTADIQNSLKALSILDEAPTYNFPNTYLSKGGDTAYISGLADFCLAITIPDGDSVRVAKTDGATITKKRAELTGYEILCEVHKGEILYQIGVDLTKNPLKIYTTASF